MLTIETLRDACVYVVFSFGVSAMAVLVWFLATQSARLARTLGKLESMPMTASPPTPPKPERPPLPPVLPASIRCKGCSRKLTKVSHADSDENGGFLVYVCAACNSETHVRSGTSARPSSQDPVA